MEFSQEWWSCGRTVRAPVSISAKRWRSDSNNPAPLKKPKLSHNIEKCVVVKWGYKTGRRNNTSVVVQPLPHKTSTTAPLFGLGPSLARLPVPTRLEDNRECFVTVQAATWQVLPQGVKPAELRECVQGTTTTTTTTGSGWMILNQSVIRCNWKILLIFLGLRFFDNISSLVDQTQMNPWDQ